MLVSRSGRPVKIDQMVVQSIDFAGQKDADRGLLGRSAGQNSGSGAPSQGIDRPPGSDVQG